MVPACSLQDGANWCDALLKACMNLHLDCWVHKASGAALYHKVFLAVSSPADEAWGLQIASALSDWVVLYKYVTTVTHVVGIVWHCVSVVCR